MKPIYLDHAATTFIYDEVIDFMMEIMKNQIGNPSSIHSVGQEAKALIENARKSIAKILGVDSQEIIFTSCGTESNNLIIRSAVESLGVKRIITSPMEHKCVLETSLSMKKQYGTDLQFLSIDEKGNIDLEELFHFLEEDTPTLVSLMHANNEIGNLYPIQEIADKIAPLQNVYFHSDTVQTIGHFPINFKEIPLDFASSSAHKFHGPKGVGFAYIKKSSKLKGIIFGGGQERNLRSGTENVYGIAGMGKALEMSAENMNAHHKYISELKAYTIKKLKEEIPSIQFNGMSADEENSLYTVLNIFVPNSNPMLGFQLDLKGIALSQGSACSSGAAKTSMVMSRIRTDEELKNHTPFRISFSHSNTQEEVDYFVQSLSEILQLQNA